MFFLFLFFCSYSMQVINIPGLPSLFLSYGVILLSSVRKSPIRTYSRTNKVVARPPELLLSSPLLLPHYQQPSQITYTSVFSPRSQYVLILPLPWKNTEINRFINGGVGVGRWGWYPLLGCPSFKGDPDDYSSSAYTAAFLHEALLEENQPHRLNRHFKMLTTYCCCHLKTSPKGHTAILTSSTKLTD